MAGHKRQATLLRRALALWRGPAFADFAYEPFVQAEAARLEEARLACLEERVEADLALGEHGELIGELERLVHEEPLRERLRAQLMLALYRSGRQVEALELYRETRRVWSEELGIEPGAALRDLEAAILRQDEELELPEAAARAQEPDQEHSEPRSKRPAGDRAGGRHRTEWQPGPQDGHARSRRGGPEAARRRRSSTPRFAGGSSRAISRLPRRCSRSTAQAWNDRSATTSPRSSASRDCTRTTPFVPCVRHSSCGRQWPI